MKGSLTMIVKIITPFFLFFLIQGILFAQLNNITEGNDWNNGGGNPQRNGLSTQNGPLTDSTLWQVDSGSLFGLPVYIEGNKLITMKFIEMTNSPVVCYNLTTGQLLWQKEVTGLAGRSVPLGIRDGQVYVMRWTETLFDTLYALNANNGSIIWRANVTTDATITTSVSFASNGDLLIEGNQPGNQFKIYRINYLTGTKIWETNIMPFVVGNSEMTVYGNTGYYHKQIGGASYLQAINLNNGQEKYSHIINDTHPGGAITESALMVGPNGTIYFHKQGDNITALQDNGTGLSLLWESEIFGNAPFALMCVGSDGSVYAPSNGRIIRLNPTTGQKLDSTAVLANPDLFMVRISAAANGVIYATNGENNIYAFTLNLQQLWSDNIPFTNTSGAAIGSNGLIAVAGANMLKVYTPGTVVPVELTSFTAQVYNREVILNWSTATELNNNGFEIQRQYAENEFVTIGFVRGEGTTTNQKQYGYNDKDLVNGKYSYRLKQNDFNGGYEYSEVIQVEVIGVDAFTLEQNYPNPFNPSTTIGYNLKERTNVKLVLMNAIGEEISILVNEEQETGPHNINFNASTLPSGVYFYRLQAGNFIETKKMIIMK